MFPSGASSAHVPLLIRASFPISCLQRMYSLTRSLISIDANNSRTQADSSLSGSRPMMATVVAPLVHLNWIIYDIMKGVQHSESIPFMAGWLRGFFDGEGSASLRSGNKNYKHATYCLSVSNTDFALMDTCQQYLSALGIEWREWNVRRRKNRKPVRTLHISRAVSICAFSEKIGFGAPVKAATLQRIIAWTLRPPVEQSRVPEASRLWSEGHSLRCITKKMGLRPGHHSRLKIALQNAGVNVPPFGKGRKRCPCS